MLPQINTPIPIILVQILKTREPLELQLHQERSQIGGMPQIMITQRMIVINKEKSLFCLT